MDDTRRMGTLGALPLAIHAAMLPAGMVRPPARVCHGGRREIPGPVQGECDGPLVSKERTMTWMPYLQLAMSILTMVLIYVAVRWETRK